MSSDTHTPWGGRFSSSPSEFLFEFGASIGVDRRMWREDISGSVAHATMLAAQGVISEGDAAAIRDGLAAIGEDIEAGRFEFSPADEDIHMAIEGELTRRIGAAGARLHTGRSRNDQVATDTRLYAKRRTAEIRQSIRELQRTLVAKAEAEEGTVLPGYTHLQRAQPVLLAHHLLAYVWMLERDFIRFGAAHEAADVSPLGSAALAGTTYPIDRSATASALGFSSVSANSLDAVSDRDFLLDALHACSTTMVHLSRLCEELIVWSTEEFGFVRMDDTHSTGSSIMPQKKNPDFAELVRGKVGRVVGSQVGLLTVLKGLPLAYNKDMQEDKEGAFDAFDTVEDSLRAVAGMIAGMTVNRERMRDAAHGGFMAATDLADYLVGKDLPFRDAHEVVGKVVLLAERSGRTLQEVTLDELRAASDLFGEDVSAALDIDGIVSRRTSAGGTGHASVADQLAAVKDILERD